MVLATLLAGLVIFGLARAAEPLELQVLSSETFFSPDGDGQEDVASMLYCLSQPANVDIFLADASGHPVRTIESGVSHQGSCAGPVPQFQWDGKDDAGQAVPDGVYTAHLRARTADAESGDVTVRLGVDTRAPGALSNPSPGAELSGTVDWVFTPTDGFDLDMVSVSCQGGSGGVASADSPGPDGRFRGTLDVSGCTNGDSLLHSAVSWTDPFGRSHSWSAAAVAVTIRNPPQLTVASSERYFSPNGDDQEDVASVAFCLSQPAEVDIWVASGSDTRVRTIESGVAHDASCRPFSQLWFEWDGKDDAGRVVADGVYTVHLTARNAGGDSGEVRSRLGVDTRAPGALTAPAAGAELSGTVEWSFAPTHGFDLATVWVSCRGAPASVSDAADPDGRFTGTLDVSDCSNGDNWLYPAVSWTDPFGMGHTWSAEAVAVTVRNAPRVVFATPERYFSPNGDGQGDAITVAYCLTQPADVDIWVADGSGARVRTIESAVAHQGGPCQWTQSWFEWDGKDDAGEVVPDGVYTAHLTARNAGGDSGDMNSRLGVDTRLPGALTAPAAGAELSGTVEWAFTPTDGFDVTTVWVSCQGGASSSSGAAGPDGRFTGTLDVTACADGDNLLQASVSWNDPFGQSQSWSAQPTPVTVRSAPQLSLATDERYFSPDGDGQEDAFTAGYCLSQDAEVDIWVADASGARVRTIESGVAHQGAPCQWTQSWFEWDGKDDAGRVVADGVYTTHLTARNTAGDSGDATIRMGVDTRTPGAIMSPAPGDTLAGLARFAVQPGAGFTPDRIDLSFDSGGHAAIHNASPDGLWRTSMYTGSLRDGPATLGATLTYRDPFGAVHTVRLADVPVVIDDTALPLTVSADPASGPAPLATTFRITTSDPQARRVHYTVNFGDGSDPAAGDIDAPYPDAEVAHTYRDPGSYRAVVTVTNAAGSSSTKVVDISASGTDNTAPAATLELDATSGVAPLGIEATIGGGDADGDPLTYSLDFGDGSAPVTGSLPAGPRSHTYDKAGTYLVRLAVRDGKLTTVKTARVVVGLAEPLTADAGDDQAAVVNDPVRLDGSGSRPPTGIESYRWDLGDGTTAEGATVDHAYATAGTYTAKITVTADGRSATDTAVITVAQRPAQDGLIVTARDEGGAPVADAQLVVVTGSGTRHSATTAADGSGSIRGLPDGAYTVYAWRQGYLPAKATATVTAGAGEATVTFKAGQVATASLSSTPLTLEQVIAAGIDPTDPDNQHVYEFTINLAFEPDDSSPAKLTGLVASGGFPRCPVVDGQAADCGPSGASFSTDSGYHVSMSVSYVHDRPQIVWLVIPGKASWLKEFFSVQMMVSNLADPDFTLSNGSATLAVPEGLTLAPTAVRQSATAALEDIPGGQSRTATWVLRGDTEGFYDLSASYAGILEPFGDTVTVEARSQKQLHVWGGSALQLTVNADETATEHYPYHVTVGLKNVADVPVYNPTIELLKEGKKNYIYQPREQLVVTTAELAPGDTLQRDYILVPTISGTLDLSKSFVSKTAGDVELPWTITSRPPVNPPDRAPKIEAFGMKDKVGLAWEGDPDVEYQIFSTPDPETDFPGQPVPGLQLLPESGGRQRAVVRNVPAGTEAWYAVSALVDGRPLMRPPLVNATSTSESPAPEVRARYLWPGGSAHTCDPPADTTRPPRIVRFTFSDPFFDVTEYRITLPDGTVSSPPDLKGHEVKKDLTLPLKTGQQLTVTAQARNSDGDQSRLWTETFDTDCERQTAVVLAMGLNSSLEGDGSDAPVLRSSTCPDHPEGSDNFIRQAAANACDAQDDPVGNLVSYLHAKGYESGESRRSTGRTLLEFSYNGADVSCPDGAAPTFAPRPYKVADTYVELVRNLSINATSIASEYVDQLKKYSDCWKKRKGQELTFAVVGHSEGGYEALAIAAEAAARPEPLGYAGLISSVVTVDGAVHPHVIPLELQVGGCFVGVDSLKLPADVLQSLALKPATSAALLAARLVWSEVDRQLAEDRIAGVQAAGIKVATVTNFHDGCLSLNATLNDAANETAIFYVDHGTSGMARHSALLTSHRPPTQDPGFPLASFLDGYVPHEALLPPLSSSRVAAARAPAAVVEAETGRLTGRVVHPETGRPVDSGQVVASTGTGHSVYTTVAADGKFSFDELPVGDYRLFVHPFAKDVKGSWVGGATMEQARTFSVAAGTIDAGDVSGLAMPQVLVKLTGTDGRPITDGVAVLADAEGREAAIGRADAAGVVTLTAPPGTYSVGAASPSTTTETGTVDLRRPTTVTLELEPAAVVTATVKDQNGAPRPGVVAVLYSGGKPPPWALPAPTGPTRSPAWTRGTTPSSSTRR